MPDVEFLFFGDLHINGLTSLFPNYDIDPNQFIYRSLQKVLNYARENQIDHLICGGDIFDTPFPSQKSQKDFLNFLTKYQQFKWYFPAGNHDYSDVETLSLDLAIFASNIAASLNHVKFFTKPELLYIEGIPFSFLPWPNCKTLHNPSVNIAHVEIPGSMSDNGKVFKDGYKIDKTGTWLLGHLHRRQVYKNIHYVGMLHSKTFGEPSDGKGFYHSHVRLKAGKLLWDHEWVPIEPPYKLVNLKVLDPQDLKKVTKPDPKKIIQYRLLLKNGVELPPGYLEDFPNVIDVSGRLTVREMDELEKQNFSIDLSNKDVDLLDGLDEFLENDGLTSKQIERAHKLLEPMLTGL